MKEWRNHDWERKPVKRTKTDSGRIIDRWPGSDGYKHTNTVYPDDGPIVETIVKPQRDNAGFWILHWRR